MDWTQILTVFAVIATNLGTIIALYCQLDKKLDEHRRETTQILIDMRLEIKAEITEIRREVSELYHCVKDHHARLSVLEDRQEKK